MTSVKRKFKCAYCGEKSGFSKSKVYLLTESRDLQSEQREYHCEHCDRINVVTMPVVEWNLVPKK